jgi:hypothetical protein
VVSVIAMLGVAIVQWVLTEESEATRRTMTVPVITLSTY